MTPSEDRGHQEAAEQRPWRADQQDAPGPAERRHLPEGGVYPPDAGRRPHAGAGLQELVGCRRPGTGAGQPGQTKTRLARQGGRDGGRRAGAA